MTGDGELQEGQNFEALQAAASHATGNLWVLVDRNELQSDKPTEEILALGDLEAKLRRVRLAGRVVRRSRSRRAARASSPNFRSADDRPKVLVANTIKGKGVSFMEHPAALREGGGTYRWHAGAPDDDAFARAQAELLERIRERFPTCSSSPVDEAEQERAYSLEGEPESGAATRRRSPTNTSPQAYGEELLELAERHPQLVVLDADLASDCRIRPFELAHPDAVPRSGHRGAGHGVGCRGDGRKGFCPSSTPSRRSSPPGPTSRSTTRRANARRSSTRCTTRG